VDGESEDMIVIGIDPSLTSTGICVMSEHGNILSTKAITSYFTGVRRLKDFKEQIIDMCQYVAGLKEKTSVFIEGYSFGSIGRKEFIAELGGTIRLTLHEQELEFIDVPPTVLKKYITGKGNADKVAVGVAVMKQYGEGFDTTDQTDAFVLCQIGLAYFGLIPNLTKVREEVIADMKKPKAKKITKTTTQK